MVFDKVKQIISEQFNISEDEVTLSTSFTDDLNADSLDVFQVIMAIEEEFDGIDLFDNIKFDYSIYKSGIDYPMEDYQLIKLKCNEYKQKKHVKLQRMCV